MIYGGVSMKISFLAERIDSEVLNWATKNDCPLFIRDYIANFLLKALGINGVAGVFCKCKNGGYNLSWYLDSGEEFIETFSEKKILDSLKNKCIDYEWSMRKLNKTTI